ncbi:MAG: transcriptional repressor [Pseudomonadota bacterium]
MCKRCDYPRLLNDAGLEQTPHRLRVLEVIGDVGRPLSAQEVLTEVNRGQDVNKVTVYRILELLVEHNLVERISSGDRSFRYGLAPNENHRSHPHFFCLTCGRMECLSPAAMPLDMDSLKGSVSGAVRGVQIRLDGSCRECLQKKGLMTSSKKHEPAGRRPD